MHVGLSRSLAAVVGAALLLGAGVAGAGSGGGEDPAVELRAGIRDTVKDQDRAARMLATVDEIEALVGELDRLVGEERAAIGGLLRDHGSSRAAVDASLEVFNGQREALALRVLTAHAALKAEATPAEWKKLRKLEMDMVMAAATKALGQASPAGKES